MSDIRSEIKRKSFHVLALGYVGLLYLLPNHIYLGILAAGWVAVSAVEWLRLTRPAVNEWIFARFGGLFRAHERAHLTGLFWMLSGVIVCVAVSRTTAAAAACLLYVIFGDGVASLAGKKIQGPKWPGSPKSFSGSAACFLVCAGAGWALLPGASWGVIAGAALVATVVEVGYLPLDDNFSVPVFAGLFLHLF